ncbi:DUF2459 domain-containing protein [Oricola cellulosilytica]|uniref:DUF2459 domain-containing protein n=1 Tax=Oricola cellulosilytica TaxID=1429082 RepID=A0A4R0PBD7_9HYPH|nr:DUF2459 domain-containing protein [Oricola cellulosilytica]TCD14572.1 DUF2459 domain-containing protein [Oricola cellulosilytica]
MLRRTFGVLVAVLALFVAVVIAGAIPVPAASSSVDGRPGGEVVRIYVLSNGFHSDIALPADGGETLGSLGLNGSDYPVEIERVRYWAFGWGSRTAYTSLRELSDLSIGIALRALAFDETVMHVLPLKDLEVGPGVYAYDLTGDAYAALLERIREAFGENAQIIPDITQGFGDRFYLGSGRFSPWRACNVWTGEQLRATGIGVGLWTPFAQSLEFGLERTATQTPSMQ